MARKKQYHNPNDLDLHGVKHSAVEVLVEDHILTHKPPYKIVTGNSTEMKRICKMVLDRHKYQHFDGFHNSGCMDIIFV